MRDVISSTSKLSHSRSKFNFWQKQEVWSYPAIRSPSLESTHAGLMIAVNPALLFFIFEEEI
jgi:hypothetical protein